QPQDCEKPFPLVLDCFSKRMQHRCRGEVYSFQDFKNLISVTVLHDLCRQDSVEKLCIQLGCGTALTEVAKRGKYAGLNSDVSLNQAMNEYIGGGLCTNLREYKWDATAYRCRPTQVSQALPQ